MAIFGTSDKPGLGKPPAYATTVIDNLPGLTTIDSLVMKAVGDEALHLGHKFLSDTNVQARLVGFDITDEALFESLQVLDDRHYVKVQRASGSISYVEPTHYGFDQYARTYLSDYQATVDAVGYSLLNTEIRAFVDLAEALGKPQFLIEHILDTMEQKNL